jgi:hypothetical protein
MPDTDTCTAREPFPAKARVLTASLADFAIDLALPTLIYLLLTPTGLSAVVRLTIGGFFTAGKAGDGRLADHTDHGHGLGALRAFLCGAVIGAASAAVTVTAIKLGAPTLLAVGLGTVLLAVAELVSFLKKRHPLDGFAILVLIELATSVAVTVASNNARFVLIRPSFYTAVAGIYALTTLRSARPLMMTVSKPMAAAGDPVRAEAFERAGRESVRFRHIEQAMTAALGLVLLAESVLRVITVLSIPQGHALAASLWSQVPAIVLLLAYFAVMLRFFVPRASREVDAFMPTTDSLEYTP